MVILIMGVSGSGKTTIGQMLAAQLDWNFQDTDDLHSPANIDKMHRGISLTDADRRPWLRSIRALIDRSIDTNLILACSALKAAYRQDLDVGADRVEFVYLKGSEELIQQRLKQRTGHFMNPDLLKSQFADLQEPDDAIVIEIDRSPTEIVHQIATKLSLAS
jgi:gluconokinase